VIATARSASAIWSCSVFKTSRRRENLPFKHHSEVAALDAVEADRLLDWALAQRNETGTLPPSRMLRQEVKRIARSEKEVALADSNEAASHKIGHRLAGVILADPPWRFANA
jgi:hypothetical protein